MAHDHVRFSAHGYGSKVQEQIGWAYSAEEYDRAGAPLCAVTPEGYVLFMQEMNCFKRTEMPVHPDSQHNTKYERTLQQVQVRARLHAQAAQVRAQARAPAEATARGPPLAGWDFLKDGSGGD